MLLSDIRFSSLLAYSPNGVDQQSSESRSWAYRLKDERLVGDPLRPASRYFVERLAVHVGCGRLSDCFGADVLVVPMPGHAPRAPDGLWVPDRLCSELVTRGLVARSERWLERVTPVAKSRQGVRITAAEHAASMRAVGAPGGNPRRVLVVDDVITRGAVGLAAISLLKQLLPESDVRLFAMIRTISDPADFCQILDPCEGVVALQADGSTVRHP